MSDEKENIGHRALYRAEIAGRTKLRCPRCRGEWSTGSEFWRDKPHQYGFSVELHCHECDVCVKSYSHTMLTEAWAKLDELEVNLKEPPKPALKPCPACGGDAMHVNAAACGGHVMCVDDGCGVYGPSFDLDGAKWNAMPRLAKESTP